MNSGTIANPYQLAINHRTLMRLAAVRFVAGATLLKWGQSGNMLAYLSWFAVTLLATALAFYGYRCCLIVFDHSMAILAALFLFAPACWLIAVLIVNGNIGDALYKHCGSVGFFGATDKQVSQLAGRTSNDAGAKESET